MGDQRVRGMATRTPGRTEGRQGGDARVPKRNGCNRRVHRRKCVTGDEFQVGATELFAAYKEWATENEEYTYDQRRFGDALSERGYKVEKSTSGPDKGRKVRTGISLRDGYGFHSRKGW
jgi:hypothetical protein